MFPHLITAEVECRDWLVTLEVTHELTAASMEHVHTHHVDECKVAASDEVVASGLKFKDAP